MEDFFELLADLLKRNDAYDPWLDVIDTEEALEALKSEISELEISLSEGDKEGILEELGDVLWTLFITLSVAEREYNLKRLDVIKGLVGKIRKRKPYIFEGRKVDIEEAYRIWRNSKGER